MEIKLCFLAILICWIWIEAEKRKMDCEPLKVGLMFLFIVPAILAYTIRGLSKLTEGF